MEKGNLRYSSSTRKETANFTNGIERLRKVMMRSIKELLRDNLIWICFLGVGLLFVGQFISIFTNPFPLPNYFNNNFKFTFNIYVNFWGIWIAFILFCIIFREKNKVILDSVKYNRICNNFKMLMLGFLIGFVLNGFCAAVAILHGDIKLTFYKFEIVNLILLFIAVFIQSSSEELIFRGFIYQRLKNRYKNIGFAIIVNSIFFAVLHLGNNGMSVTGFIDILLSGVFFSLMFCAFDSIWLVMACHTTWNFTQNILLGLPNSGTLSKYSLFMMDKNSATSSFAFDKNFGLEGAALSTTLMFIGCVIMYIYCKKNNKFVFRLSNYGDGNKRNVRIK